MLTILLSSERDRRRKRSREQKRIDTHKEKKLNERNASLLNDHQSNQQTLEIENTKKQMFNSPSWCNKDR